MSEGFRSARSQPQRPVVVVLSGGPDSVVREVLAGIEEEGVPCTVESVTGQSATALAIRAAAQSPLQVGIGVDADGEVSVCHVKLEQPVFELTGGSSPARLRTLGHNAARIVAGLPLRTVTDG
ncbi:glycerol dehydratase reactivase beta/small subunit family protein [Mycolicibacterium bacteremicum]|uniref:glycerol dehydratase reactivase beta/small subunit family protein n=1 Tax=Mycolicibacterium bacteremicum TaxID=564198 RepID=UPI0026F1ADF2|nr:glycerol dehydratase reactivase beta/small subunit family protein [Mycolicibacterium bacteremicum]